VSWKLRNGEIVLLQFRIIVQMASMERVLTAGYLPVPPAVRYELGKIGPVMGISLFRRFPRLPLGAWAMTDPARGSTTAALETCIAQEFFRSA
jgi:hypothetical protein